MTEIPRAMSRRDLIGPSVMAGAMLTYLELLSIVRDPDWAGLTMPQWAGLSAGIAIYAALVAILSMTSYWPAVAQKLGPAWRPLYGLNAVGLFAVAIWIGFGALETDSPALPIWMVIIAFALVFNSAFVVIHASHLRIATLAVVWVGAFMSAGIVLVAADSMLTTYPERIDNATRSSFIWLGVALIFGHAFALLTRRWRASVVVYAIMTLVPVALATLIPSLQMGRVDPVGPPVILITHTDGKPEDGTEIHKLLTSSDSEAVSVPSVVKVFQARGYSTAAFVGLAPDAVPKSVIGDFELVQQFNPRKTERAGWIAGLPRLHGAVRAIAPAAAPTMPLDVSRRAQRSALRYMSERGISSFFLWINLNGADAWLNSHGWSPLVGEFDERGFSEKAVISFVPINAEGMLGAKVTGPGTERIEWKTYGSILDFAPTIVEVTGGTPLPEWRGRSDLKMPGAAPK